VGEEPDEGLNLVPPEEGFELYRYNNAEEMTTKYLKGIIEGCHHHDTSD
jgi:hypothetical protein